MHIFLTSSPFGDYRSVTPAPFLGWNPSNSFMDNITKCWKEQSKILYIAADPDFYSLNDQISRDFRQKFEESHLSFSVLDICDHRYRMNGDVNYYDVLILGGGHVPTQNRFLHEINLPNEIQGFDGIVIGISAGSMNCASSVYAQPEEAGETYIPHEKRFFPGLNVCWVNVLPHYNAVKHDYVDGLRLYEDITIQDSYGHCFVVLEDGSYVYQKHDKVYLYGKGYVIQDGNMHILCENGQCIDLEVLL